MFVEYREHHDSPSFRTSAVRSQPTKLHFGLYTPETWAKVSLSIPHHRPHTNPISSGTDKLYVRSSSSLTPSIQLTRDIRSPTASGPRKMPSPPAQAPVSQKPLPPAQPSSVFPSTSAPFPSSPSLPRCVPPTARSSTSTISSPGS